MSTVYLSRTNQKLNFARIHLEALTQACSDNGWSKHAQIESYNESVLFHMASAYASLLSEIAERYRLSFVQEARVNYRALEIQMAETGQECPELRELAVLEENASSWLHKMLAAYEGCWQAEGVVSQSVVDTAKSVSEIHVMQVNPDHTEESAVLQECSAWFEELRTLIARLREGMQEW